MPRSPRSAAPSAARTTRPSCTRWTRSRFSCRKTPSFARPSTDLSRASRCDPQPFRRSPHCYPRRAREETRIIAGVCARCSPSTALDGCYDYEVVSFCLTKTLETFMEVVLDRDAFLRGLQMVHNIVEPRQTLPILANVLLETEGEAIRLTATDLEVGARVAVPAKIIGTGAITISARKLLEIVKELPAAPLSLKSQENAWVALRCGGASYKLVGLTPEDFPGVGENTAAPWITLDGKLLHDMLAQTSFAISHDESRYALN